MTYTTTIYDSLADVPADDWPLDAADDLPMDRRLIGAFAETMAGECRTWFVVARDGGGRMAALAAACRFVVDGLETTGPRAQAVTRGVRTLIPRFMKFGVLFCGLPVPGGESQFRLLPGADPAAAVGAVDGALRRLARRTRSRLVVWREFDAPALAAVEGLAGHGYLRGEVPCGHTLVVPPGERFRAVEDYVAALRSGYRRQVAASRKKFAAAGCAAVSLTGAAAAAAFTDEAHALYRNVRARAEYRMETLTPAFFRAVATAFGPAANLTLVRVGGRPVGFAFGLQAGEAYHNLYVGLDYAANAAADVYFNLYYHDLDQAFRRGCTRVHLGQTSDAFKTRLGSTPRPLWFFARGTGAAVHWGLRRCARWVFPPVGAVAPRDVFRRPAFDDPAAPRGQHFSTGTVGGDRSGCSPS